jgi:putative ABC transport system permease protein
LSIPLLVLTASFVYGILKIGNSLQIAMLKTDRLHWDKRRTIPVFNILQLAISITLLAGSIVIIKQIKYITHKQIGLNKDVLEIKVAHRDKNLSNIFKSELEKQACIEMVSIAEASPVLEHWAVLQKYNDNGTEKQYTSSVFLGDQNYIKTLGINILKGSDFSQDGESNKNKCIVNESLAKLFPGQTLIGNELPGNKELTVIGVAKDFHYGSLKELVAPGYIVYGNTGFYLMAKPVNGQLTHAREVITKTLDIPDHIDPTFHFSNQLIFQTCLGKII